jgi:hypothetical protein
MVTNKVMYSISRLWKTLKTFQNESGSLVGPDINLVFIRGLQTPFQLVNRVFQNLVIRGRDEFKFPKIWLGQTQAYWIRANLRIYEMLEEETFLTLAIRTGNALVLRQKEGWWKSNLIGLSNRLDVIHNTLIANSLFDLYELTGDKRYIESVLAYDDVLNKRIGFTYLDDGSAFVKYFSGGKKEFVCNANTLVLSFLGRLTKIGYSRKEVIEPLLKALSNSMLENGELPYDARFTLHYQCTQYNAFELIDLIEYQYYSSDNDAEKLIDKIARWLASRVTSEGHVWYQCNKMFPLITYHHTATLAALSAARSHVHFNECVQKKISSLLKFCLERQMKNGLFEYGIFRLSFHDRGAYLRPNCIILKNLADFVFFGSSHINLDQ